MQVLLVEENPTLLWVLELFLDIQPDVFIVGKAASQEAAIQLVSHQRPQVMLVNLSQIGSVGIDTIRQLRGLAPFTFIGAIPPIPCKAYCQAVLTAGADAFVHNLKLHQKLIPLLRTIQRYQLENKLTNKILPISSTPGEG